MEKIAIPPIIPEKFKAPGVGVGGLSDNFWFEGSMVLFALTRATKRHTLHFLSLKLYLPLVQSICNQY